VLWVALLKMGLRWMHPALSTPPYLHTASTLDGGWGDGADDVSRSVSIQLICGSCWLVSASSYHPIDASYVAEEL
jgi:hypothetical protein